MKSRCRCYDLFNIGQQCGNYRSGIMSEVRFHSGTVGNQFAYTTRRMGLSELKNVCTLSHVSARQKTISTLMM
jgi:hypothetical protein